jgi:tellurite resistance protein
VESLMADGRISKKERSALLRLQRDLGLSGDEANRLEGEVLAP